MGGLPEGVRGRVLAVLLLLLVIAAAWVAVASPLLDWQADRADHLAIRATLARRMEQIAAELPELKRLDAAAPTGAAPVRVLEGATDALAGATLQQAVQDVAGKTGASLSSTEALPVEQLGRYRRIAVRVALSAPWPVFVRFLDSIIGGSPRMLVNDLQVQGRRSILLQAGDGPLTGSMVVFGFRLGTAPGGA